MGKKSRGEKLIKCHSNCWRSRFKIIDGDYAYLCLPDPTDRNGEGVPLATETITTEKCEHWIKPPDEVCSPYRKRQFNLDEEETWI